MAWKTLDVQFMGSNPAPGLEKIDLNQYGAVMEKSELFGSL